MFFLEKAEAHTGKRRGHSSFKSCKNIQWARAPPTKTKKNQIQIQIKQTHSVPSWREPSVFRYWNSRASVGLGSQKPSTVTVNSLKGEAEQCRHSSVFGNSHLIQGSRKIICESWSKSSPVLFPGFCKIRTFQHIKYQNQATCWFLDKIKYPT